MAEKVKKKNHVRKCTIKKKCEIFTPSVKGWDKLKSSELKKIQRPMLKISDSKGKNMCYSFKYIP